MPREYNALSLQKQFKLEHYDLDCIELGHEAVCFGLVNEDGELLAQVNCFYYDNDSLIVDVIDKLDRYNNRKALTFNDGMREFHEAPSGLVSVDFRHKDK